MNCRSEPPTQKRDTSWSTGMDMRPQGCAPIPRPGRRYTRRMQTFAEFWPFYLREHSRPATRTLHLVGTTLSLLLLASAAALRSGTVVLVAVVTGYAFAWVGHFFVEHNRPATFKYPLWSLAADWKMWMLAITGRLAPELNRAGVKPQRSPQGG